MAGPQTEFYLSEAKHPAFLAGRGGSKTFTLSAKAFKLATQHAGIRGVLTQPTFDMIRRNFVPVWEKQFGHLGGDKGVWQWRVFQAGVPSEIVFSNGAVIDLRPADSPEKFRGATYGFFGMDEIAIEDQLGVFLSLMPTLRQEGYPLQGFVTSTPSARRPWIRKVWVEHVNPFTEAPLTASDYPIFRAKTKDNWHLPKGEYEHWLEMYGDTRLASQELEGEFVALEGAAFEEFGVVHNRRPSEDDVFQKTVYGIDFGATSPTAMYELRLDLSNRVWVTREFYKRNADDYDWITALSEWGGGKVFCDPSRSEKEMAELRKRYGVNLKRSSVKRFDDRVRLVRNRLAPRDGVPQMFIDFGACPNLVSELNNLAFAQARIGEYSVDRWEPGIADHGFDGLVYGLAAFDRYSGPPPRIPVTVRGWEY